MSRSRPVDGATISLFPFLAVLLCMMGALLVLLVLFSRSAHNSESPQALAARQQLEADMLLAKESLAWRSEQLVAVRARTAEDLAKARLQLAGVEENSRQIADELEKLIRDSDALAATTRPLETSGNDIRLLEEKLKSSRESLDKTRAEIATKPPAYAIVPYAGSNGTHRRPLYIECSIDGVFLQPEGIRLSPSDFEGPPGPGNPLASALRAAREHISRGATASADPAAQPYPLLLVRPSGVMAYYAAREAIASWGTEFGYQLVDEDWTLTFPQRDPVLAEAETRAVEESRRRLAWLAEARPARPVKPPQQYRAATTRGGVVANGGPSVLGDQSRWNWTEAQAEGGDPSGRALDSGYGNGATAANRGGRRSGGDLILGGGSGGSAASGGVTAVESTPGTEGQNGSQAANSGGGKPFAATGKAPSLGEPNEADATQADGELGSAADLSGHPGGPSLLGSDRAGASALAGTAAVGGPPSGANAGGGKEGTGSAAASAAGTAGAGPSMPGLMSAGVSGSAGGTTQAGAASGVSLAQARGKNWASLATQDRPIPLTRPIRIECALNEFRLLDDAGHRVVTRISVGANIGAAIDPLVQAVHSRVEGWGIAGERMYWKPLLVLSETSDGRSRREELERLLADSGLDTKVRDDGDEIRKLPPIERRHAMLVKP